MDRAGADRGEFVELSRVGKIDKEVGREHRQVALEPLVKLGQNRLTCMHALPSHPGVTVGDRRRITQIVDRYPVLQKWEQEQVERLRRGETTPFPTVTRQCWTGVADTEARVRSVLARAATDDHDSAPGA